MTDRLTVQQLVGEVNEHVATFPEDMQRALRLWLDDTEFAEPADVRDATDGAEIEVDGITFTVDHVPGHTPGTVFYRIDWDGPEPVSQVMFSGDFLFNGSIGRTDLTGGDHGQMQDSLRDRILPLPDDIVVLPGHGMQTSIGRERAINPFLAELVEQG